MKWSLYQIWNKSLEEGRASKPMLPRQKIWASEMGGSQVDRFLKMTGVPPSNPPNPRSLRKFEAGNIWEAIVGYVLQRAGILQQRQEWLQHQYPGLLPVSGKLDFIAGGKPDYNQAVLVVAKEFNWLPEFITRATVNIINSIQEQYPDGLEDIVLEIKSCSSFMFERFEKTNTPSQGHKLQLFHYLKCKNMKEGHVVYISKDDARMLEMPIYNPSPVEDDYIANIKQMTEYINKNERPPLEQPITLEGGSFSVNWKISYSSYLTMLYGLKDQKAFDDKYKPLVTRWNRVLSRVAEGKEMTDNNKEAIKEMNDRGFNSDQVIDQLKKENNNA